MYRFDGVTSMEQLRKPLGMQRQRSKSDGLVQKTIDFARAYSDNDLDRTERVLEAELRRESVRPPRDKKVARLRLKGERMLHSKYVLLAVVVLNLIDCALVLGELILDIHFIRELRNKSDASSQLFIDTLQTRYPEHLYEHNIDNMDLLYAQLYAAQCQWPDESVHGHVDETHGGLYNTNPHKRGTQVVPPLNIQMSSQGPSYTMKESSNNRTNSHKIQNQVGSSWNHTDQSKGNHTGRFHGDHHDDHHHHEHSIWEHVAHGMHKASITILGILFVENLFKLICMGRAFLIKKLEVFDSIVVFISFVVDLVLLKGLMEFKVQDAVFILTFLLPWRVIRVVNSLIVAVLDHEHFRLKMLYQEKKVVTAELKQLKAKEKGWDFHLKKIENFCESEGIPIWKIRQHTAMGRKQSTITSMASLALNGFLQGMVLSPSDKMLMDKSLSLAGRDIPCLGPIDESDDADNEFVEILHQTNTTDSALSYVTSEDRQKNKKESLSLVSADHTNGVRQNAHVDVEHAHAYPDHSIMKAASRATMKSVSFEQIENKPLLHRQDSFDVKDINGNNDDENFKGWR